MNGCSQSFMGMTALLCRAERLCAFPYFLRVRLIVREIMFTIRSISKITSVKVINFSSPFPYEIERRATVTVWCVSSFILAYFVEYVNTFFIKMLDNTSFPWYNIKRGTPSRRPLLVSLVIK